MGCGEPGTEFPQPIMNDFNEKCTHSFLQYSAHRQEQRRKYQ